MGRWSVRATFATAAFFLVALTPSVAPAASIRASIESQRKQELIDEALRASDFESDKQQEARNRYLGDVRNVRVFRTDAFMDAVGLFAWGLGSAAAGIGLSELTGKLTDAKGAATVK
jgi:hypothetical protein